MKNLSHLAAALGTWTADTTLKSHYHGGLDYVSVRAYAVIHLMPDPMRGYGCQSSCNAMENQVCLRRRRRRRRSNETGPLEDVCVKMEDAVVEWSDLTVFFYFGVAVTVGDKPDVPIDLSTGGWIGPYNIIVAEASTQDDNTTNITDQYAFRYVMTPSVSYLQPPSDSNKATIIPNDSFSTYLGKESVQETIRRQSNRNMSLDPYAYASGTCENGNVTAMLPHLEFWFRGQGDNNATMETSLTYKILTVFDSYSKEYALMPLIRKAFNNSITRGLAVSGPYCHHGDGNGSWAFDLNLTSFGGNDSDMSNPSFVRGCMEGLPCVPPASSWAEPSAFVDPVIHRHPVPSTTDLNKFLMILFSYFLTMALLISVTCNVQLRKKHRRTLDRLRIIHEDEVIAAAIGRRRRQEESEEANPFGDMDQQPERDHLREPLLSVRDNGVSDAPEQPAVGAATEAPV